jgi:plasmid stabilization system protein ParE
MPQGSKSKYTAKQKRQAEHIEESYEDRGASRKIAEKRAWQTVNKQTGGGEKKGGSGRKESGQRAAKSRKVGSKKVQKTPPRHKASSSKK